MASLKGSKTEQNLKDVFAGESQANRRYLYFAQKADVEGYPDVAALFRSVAEGETGHAFGHFDHLAEVGDPVTGVAVGPDGALYHGKGNMNNLLLTTEPFTSSISFDNQTRGGCDNRGRYHHPLVCIGRVLPLLTRPIKAARRRRPVSARKPGLRRAGCSTAAAG